MKRNRYSVEQIVAAAMLLINMGLTPDYWSAWVKNWVISAAVAYQATLVAVPLARRLTSRMA